jgi:branched-chain amino acid transport system permease protein
MLNLAHGALYLVGGYVAWTALNVLALPALPSLALGVAGAALVALLIQVLAINRLLGRQEFFNAAMIATVGASIVIESAVLIIYGPRVKQVPPVIEGTFKIGTVLISYQALVVIAVALVSFALLALFLRRSRHGLSIQAVSQQMDAARLMGIPSVTTFMIVMVISGALAGLAGVLLSSIFYLSPTSGFNPMIKALVVTIFGGLGSIKGTIWAAYVIGLLEAFLQVYFGAGAALPGLFLFMIIMLVIRPSGLFGLGEAQRL